jgi:hypothetical protein
MYGGGKNVGFWWVGTERNGSEILNGANSHTFKVTIDASEFLFIIGKNLNPSSSYGKRRYVAISCKLMSGGKPEAKEKELSDLINYPANENLLESIYNSKGGVKEFNII